MCDQTLLVFFYVLKQVPLHQVVVVVFTMLFGCEAPEMLGGHEFP